MAKYSCESDVIVGDVVKCALPGCNCCDGEVIEAISGSNVRRSGCIQFFESTSFELVSRAPSPEQEQPAVNHEQSPPLVAWPDAGPLTFEKLSIKELFVTAEAPQTVRVKISDTEACVIAGGTHGIGHVFRPFDVHRIVFRVKQAVAPQFTVI